MVVYYLIDVVNGIYMYATNYENLEVGYAYSCKTLEVANNTIYTDRIEINVAERTYFPDTVIQDLRENGWSWI